MVKGKLVSKRANGSVRTDYLFRVSLKAVIYNEQGQLLVVKEHGLNWGLPGGGMDFGETFGDALARELKEEVGYTGAFTFDAIDTADPMHLQSIDVWLMWIVFHVKPENMNFSKGVDSEDVKFIDISELAKNDDLQAQYAIHYHTRLQERLAR